MTVVIDESRLRELSEENFLSVLDVALDIQSELDFRRDPIYIPLRRDLIRYAVLCPANTINLADRYCDLRWKAAEFLEREGYLTSVEWKDTGGHRWQSFIEIAVADETQFQGVLSLLKAEEARRYPRVSAGPDGESAMARIGQLCDSFHRVCLRLRSRHAGRVAFDIRDEYDVQDLLGALLETRFHDIRREEWTPSYAGKQARVDFLLKAERVVVEAKMTREGLTDAAVGDELIVDIARYKQSPDCSAIFCFVYDPSYRLKRPDSMETDLSGKREGLEVRAVVRPHR